MNEEMKVEVNVEVEPLVFEAYEVDIDYEFDATMYFDFSRAETQAEARLAELWFESAKSYPPSPFVSNLFVRESTLPGTINSSQELGKTGESLRGENNINIGPVLPVLETDNRVGGTTACKSFVPRSSTLMKPTASQLAKQNSLSKPSISRFQKLPLKNDARSFCKSSGVESHALKKQKLDGGYSCKVIEEQPAYFFHKASRKDVPVDKTALFSKLKLTIPREPDLETTHRAQRLRSKNSNTEFAQEIVETRRFKARPLNRKILEAPSIPLPKKSSLKLPDFQEFHLKTSERATQKSSAVLSNSSPSKDFNKVSDKHGTSRVSSNNNKENGRLNTVCTPKQDGHSVTQNFKAPPSNRKMFLSKGDNCVYRNTKREATTPMELNLHTQKRIQQPPTDLFSKLSLKSESLPNNRNHPYSKRSRQREVNI